ncbi:hypothetical protein [Solihabitans fulvus]|nr:hypothetical protein [Solihabitans fulvus]
MGLNVREPSFDPDEVVGWPVEKAARRFETEGFDVQRVDLDRNPWMTTDLRLNRIRLTIRDGRVVSAHQG